MILRWQPDCKYNSWTNHPERNSFKTERRTYVAQHPPAPSPIQQLTLNPFAEQWTPPQRNRNPGNMFESKRYRRRVPRITLLGMAILMELLQPVQQPAQPTHYVGRALILLYDQLKRYFNQEFGESNVDSQKTMSVEDCRALTVFKESIQLHDGHCNVSIPWKRNPPDLPKNRRLAQKRLEYLKNRLQEDPKFLYKEQQYWPKNVSPQDLSEDDVKVKKILQTHSVQISASNDMTDQIFCKFSNWIALKKPVAWLLRYKC
eukprot:gene13206-14558_t